MNIRLAQCRYVALVVLEILFFQDSITCELISAEKNNGDAVVVKNGFDFNSGDTMLHALRSKREALKKEALKEKEINQKLENIEKDLKTLKTYGPLFIYFLSSNKKFYKLVLMIMMYLFLFTFYYQKVRRSHEKMNDDANTATTNNSTNIQEENSTDFCAIDIPTLSGQSS